MQSKKQDADIRGSYGDGEIAEVLWISHLKHNLKIQAGPIETDSCYGHGSMYILDVSIWLRSFNRTAKNFGSLIPKQRVIQNMEKLRESNDNGSLGQGFANAVGISPKRFVADLTKLFKVVI